MAKQWYIRSEVPHSNSDDPFQVVGCIYNALKLQCCRQNRPSQQCPPQRRISYRRFTWGTRSGHFSLGQPWQQCKQTSLCARYAVKTKRFLFCHTWHTILRDSLFGVSNVQAFIYFQTHRDSGITNFKLVVRSYCLYVGSIPDVSTTRSSDFGTHLCQHQWLKTPTWRSHVALIF
jgi:hypothetical protein